MLCSTTDAIDWTAPSLHVLQLLLHLALEAIAGSGHRLLHLAGHRLGRSQLAAGSRSDIGHVVKMVEYLEMFLYILATYLYIVIDMSYRYCK